MGAVVISVEDDLVPFVDDINTRKANAMIRMTIAMASSPWIAPCIVEDAFQYPDQAKSILVDAILRWNDAGTGVITNHSAGSFQETIDTRTGRKRLFWPSEIKDLQRLCGVARTGRAFTIDTTPPPPVVTP